MDTMESAPLLGTGNRNPYFDENKSALVKLVTNAMAHKIRIKYKGDSGFLAAKESWTTTVESLGLTEQAKAMVVHLAFDSQELVEASNIVAKGTRENEDSKQIWNRLQKIYWTNENETTAWNDLVEMKYSPGTDFHAHLEQARIKAIATGTPDRTQVAFISRTVPQGLRESMEADIRATEDPVEYVAKLKAKFERYPVVADVAVKSNQAIERWDNRRKPATPSQKPLFENNSSRLDVRSKRPAEWHSEGRPPSKTRFAAQQPAERLYLVENTKMRAQPRRGGQMGWPQVRQENISSPANPMGQSEARTAQEQEERFRYSRQNGLCDRCLAPGHVSRTCRGQYVPFRGQHQLQVPPGVARNTQTGNE